MTTWVNEFVQASAGTGKTRYLIRTILARLLLGELEMKDLLAITFTEKAANEMRNRLVDALMATLHDEAISELDGKTAVEYAPALSPALVRRNARKALDEIDRGFIGTIHSFCRRVLKEYPHEAHIAAGAMADEGEHFNELFEQAWNQWLVEQLQAPSESWVRILKQVSLEELNPLARELASFAMPGEVLNHPHSARQKSREKGQRLLKQCADEFFHLLQHYGERLNAAPRGHAQFYIPFLQAAAEGKLDGRLKRQMQTEASYHEVTKTQVEKLPTDEGNRLRDIISFTKGLKDLDDDLLGEILVVLTPFAGNFRRDYLARGYLTFDAMLILTRELLRNREVRERLKERFRLILVDEFQDTDPLQYEIILYIAEKLGEHELEWHKIKLQPDKLIVVGDPKQSIYAFRGTDLDAYAGVGKLIQEQGITRTLDKNYRSCQNIILAVNAVFKRLLPSEPTAVQPPYAALECGEPGLCHDRPDCVEFIEITDGENVLEKSRLEARYIARRIAGLKSGGYSLKNIALLLRKLTRAHEYMEALRQAGIEYVIEGDKYFYHTSEVIELYNLLCCIVDPMDRIALVGVLRSPFVGLDDREIYELKQKNGLSYFRTRGLPPRIARFFKLLRDLHETALRQPVHEVLRIIFERTTLLPSCYEGYRKEIAVANILKVYYEALELSRRPSMTLQAFLVEFERRMKEEDEGEDPVADEELDAVRIMSIHKAKGLQFDTVFLAGLSEGIRHQRGKSASANWFHRLYGFACGKTYDLGMLALMEHDQRMQEAEARRLLYVAMTRAKCKMVLTTTKRASNQSEETFTDLLNEALADFAPEEQALLCREKVGEEQIERLAVTKEESPTERLDIEELEKTLECIGELSHRASEPYMLTATSRVEEYKRTRLTPLEEGSAPPSRGALVGTVCHAVLAAMGAAPLDELLRRETRLACVRVASHEAEAVHHEAYEILHAYLASELYGKLSKMRLLAREVPFLLQDNGRLVSGRIDVLFEEGTDILVVDYKTDRGVDETELVKQYAPQLELYRRAVSTAFPSRKIRKALVWLPSARWIEV